eukprot:PITA_27966
MEEVKDLASLTVDELMGSLLSHEARIDINKDSTLETAFKSQVSISRDRGRGRSRSRGGGRSERYRGQRDGREEHEHESGSNYKSFNNNQRVEKSKVRCYYCNKFGHYAHDCSKKIVDQGNQRANVTTKSTDSIFLACHTMHEPSASVWLLDSGCSNHMIGNKNLVANFDQYVKTEVKLGTDKTVEVDGKGVVNILTKLLQQKQMVRELLPIKEIASTCECCILGKKHHESFLKGVAYREKQPLELVHTDLCGPMRTQSIGGNCYFLTFIDDYSRKTWVYFLKQKSETFARFKEFKALAENQIDRQIKVLRS